LVYSSGVAKKRLGELLIERGAIDDRQLTSALSHQRERGGRIGQALVTKGFLTEEQLVAALGEELGLPVIDIPNQVDAEALKLLKAQFCESHDAFPLHVDSAPAGGRRTLTLVLADPLDLPTLEEVEFTTGCRVQPALATTSQIRLAILRHYYKQNVDQRRAGSRMTVVRRGGMEEEVDTSLSGQAPAALTADAGPAPSAPTLPPRFGDNMDADEAILSLTDEIAEPTEEVDPQRIGLKRPFLAARADAERFEQLERKFWALMRLMESKGLITTEEFLEEFDL
jgi:hypothetical protein